MVTLSAGSVFDTFTYVSACSLYVSGSGFLFSDSCWPWMIFFCWFTCADLHQILLCLMLQIIFGCFCFVWCGIGICFYI